MNKVIGKIREMLRTRKQAYRYVFHGSNEDGQYSIQGARVLDDLAKFCKAHQSPFHLDERATLIMMGRQEVFQRIQHQLHMTDDQLWDFYAEKNPSP